MGFVYFHWLATICPEFRDLGRHSAETSRFRDDPDKTSYQSIPADRLVEALGRAHGSLDGQGTDVLPSLLQQRDEVVDGQHDVADQLILSHADVANSDTHAEHLLELELDGRLDLGDLVGQIFGVRDGGRELSGLGQTGTQETWDLLDQSIRRDKGVVLARQLLDELFVLVEPVMVSLASVQHYCSDSLTSSSRQQTWRQRHGAWLGRYRAGHRGRRWPCEDGGQSGA
jgi:hypothetical protein